MVAEQEDGGVVVAAVVLDTEEFVGVVGIGRAPGFGEHAVGRVGAEAGTTSVVVE